MRVGIPGIVGHTPLIKIPSLSRLTGSDIFLKCENLNPGGSVKDRAAANMIATAMAEGKLKPGMTIVEGTAGNTGIGLTLVGRSLGFDSLIVMPKGQAQEKEATLRFYGADLKLVDPCPFANPNHFFHTAKRIAEEDPQKYWWANQFDNLANFRAHYENTGPEIARELGGKVDALVSVAGTGGTIAGTSAFLKGQDANTKVVLADPAGSGLKTYFEKGEFVAEGSSITEGIGIMRLVENFKQAKVDEAVTLDDSYVVSLAHYLRAEDGIVLGSSAALNVAVALREARMGAKGRRVVTFWCDEGQRSASKLYNVSFLDEKGLAPSPGDVETWFS